MSKKLIEIGRNRNLEILSAQQLNDDFKQLYYISASEIDREMYNVNTLESTKYSLNRCLKWPPVLKTFDFINNNDFNEINIVSIPPS